MSEIDNTELLPTNFRSYAGTQNRIQYADINRYYDLYTPIERLALTNNLKAYRWALGFDYNTHKTFLSSGIGKSCIDVICDTAVNGKMSFNGPDDICEALDDELRETFTSSIENLYRLTASTGSSLNRVCFDKDGMPFISSVPLGQFKAVLDQKGKVKECKCYLDIQQGVNEYLKYILYEHRYFNKDNEPCAMYKVTLLNYTNPEKMSQTDFEKEDIKANKDLLHTLSQIYPNIKLYQEDKLGFKDSLGASVTNWTKYNSYYRSLWFGDAMLTNVLDLLYSYDSTFTYKENDKYLGRGRTLVPKQMTQASLTMQRSIDRAIASKVSMANLPEENIPRGKPLDKTFYQELTTSTGESVKPTFVQGDLRTENWNSDLQYTAGEIAARLHISACDLDSRLNGGTQRTATEINKESDNTIKLVNSKRLQFETAIVTLVKDIAYYLLGDRDFTELGISYPVVGLSNPQVATQVVLSQYQGRIMSRYTAIKRLNPDWTETDIEEEIARLDEDAMLTPEINIDDDEIS